MNEKQEAYNKLNRDLVDISKLVSEKDKELIEWQAINAELADELNESNQLTKQEEEEIMRILTEAEEVTNKIDEEFYQ